MEQWASLRARDRSGGTGASLAESAIAAYVWRWQSTVLVGHLVVLGWLRLGLGPLVRCESLSAERQRSRLKDRAAVAAIV